MARVSLGESRELVVVDGLTRTQIVQYAGASGDFNPLHTDEIFATQAAGFPSVFAHGMLTMGMTARVLTDWIGDGHLLRYKARFVKQVWPGDTLTARANVMQIDNENGRLVATFELETRNQLEEAVLIGNASALVDG